MNVEGPLIDIYALRKNGQIWPLSGCARIRRKKGLVVRGCTKYTGRNLNRGGWNLSKSKWHNPFKGDDACTKYEKYVLDGPLVNDLEELRGHLLGCFCEVEDRTFDQILEQPICHNEVLLRLLYYETLVKINNN